VCARHLPHEQDDGQHHQSGRNDCGAATDRAGERLVHHPAAGGDKDEEERAEELREKPAPLLGRILEVLDRSFERAELRADVARDRLEQRPASDRSLSLGRAHGEPCRFGNM
jgi:hypothetical protein